MSIEKTFGADLAAIQGSFNQYIISPLNAFGLGGFVFDIEGDTNINLTAEITDHYIENNSAIQDHIAIKPKKAVLKNYVGEVVYRLDTTTNQPLQRLTQKLTTLNQYVPILAAGARQAKAFLASDSILDFAKSITNGGAIQSTVSGTADLWANIKNIAPTKSKQQQAYLFFKALFEQKILVGLQTPFEFMTNMAIESIIATQTEDSQYISDFSITLKQIRTVSSASVAFDPLNYFGAAGQQIQGVQNGGSTTGLIVGLPSDRGIISATTFGS